MSPLSLYYLDFEIVLLLFFIDRTKIKLNTTHLSFIVLITQTDTTNFGTVRPSSSKINRKYVMIIQKIGVFF